MAQSEQIHLAIAAIIRDKSRTKQLIQLDEIVDELNRQGFLESKNGYQETDFEPIVRESLKKNEDLREINGRNGTIYYYSAESLSETYVGLLVGKEEGPLQLIAETVRQNSATYPRPVPLDIFEQPPFDLTEEQILESLEAMGQQELYRDIVRTTTSIGTIFLFSSRHLHPDHASTLAEWLDVGQMSNP